MKHLINKVTQGDCLEFMKKIPDNSIDLVLTDPPFKDNRRPLRADHYVGYDKPLVVKFICIDCDGKQLRSKNKLV